MYASPQGSSDLSYRDKQGNVITLYDESYAVLIIQANYGPKTGWSSPVTAASAVEKKLTSALIERNFNVLVWRDLDSEKLRIVSREVFSRLGRGGHNARLFFFYFGHGVTLDSGPSDKRFYLVPVDARLTSNEDDFVEKALSDRDLLASVDKRHARHTFLAFEACNSGGILASLGALPAPSDSEYLQSPAVHKPTLQFLTAGNALDTIPADGSFSDLLVEALSSDSADVRRDGYITATEVMSYVSNNLGIRSRGIYNSKPEFRTIPDNGGDFIFGPVKLGTAPVLAGNRTVPSGVNPRIDSGTPSSPDVYHLSPSGYTITKSDSAWKIISTDNLLSANLRLQKAAPDAADYEFWLPGYDIMFLVPKSGGPVKRKQRGEQAWSEYGTAVR